MAERKNICGTCAAFHEYKSATMGTSIIKDGECRLNAIMDEHWPRTNEADWCLEWVNPQSIDLQHDGLPIEALRQIVADYDDRHDDDDLDESATKPN